jgi:hypothetical protein
MKGKVQSSKYLFVHSHSEIAAVIAGGRPSSTEDCADPCCDSSSFPLPGCAWGDVLWVQRQSLSSPVLPVCTIRTHRPEELCGYTAHVRRYMRVSVYVAACKRETACHESALGRYTK